MNDCEKVFYLLRELYANAIEVKYRPKWKVYKEEGSYTCFNNVYGYKTKKNLLLLVATDNIRNTLILFVTPEGTSVLDSGGSYIWRMHNNIYEIEQSKVNYVRMALFLLNNTTSNHIYTDLRLRAEMLCALSFLHSAFVLKDQNSKKEMKIDLIELYAERQGLSYELVETMKEEI